MCLKRVSSVNDFWDWDDDLSYPDRDGYYFHDDDDDYDYRDDDDQELSFLMDHDEDEDVSVEFEDIFDILSVAYQGGRGGRIARRLRRGKCLSRSTDRRSAIMAQMI